MHAPACNVANRECISICTHFYFSMHAYLHRKQHLLIGTNFTMWRKIVHYSGCMLYLLRSDSCVMSASWCKVCTSRVLWALTSVEGQCDGKYEQSAVWSEIQFWSDKTRPLVAEAGHPGPLGIQSAEQIIHNKLVDKRWRGLYLMFYNLHFKFEMSTCYFLYSVFCTSNLSGIYCHILHLTWVHVIFCIWSSRRPQPAVTGVISNKKLQILTKGEKATHSQLPPRESWVNMTWWMQWMSDLNREIFQPSQSKNLRKKKNCGWIWQDECNECIT